MEWIGQHIYDLVSRFRNDVYLENISSGTIASGAHLGLDSNNKIVKATDGGGDLTAIIAGTGLSGDNLSGPTPELSVDASQTQITSIGTITTGVWNGTAIGGNYIAATQPNIDSVGTDGDTLAILGDTLSMTNTTAWKPEINLTNQTDDATSALINFVSQRVDSSTQAGEDSDVLGKITFNGYDDQGTPATQQYAQIFATIHDATSGEESGQLSFMVASHDGDQNTGLTLTGGSEDTEIDVAIGQGANSVTTVNGTLTMGSTAAMTNAGLVSVAGQTNITSLGTLTALDVDDINLNGKTLTITGDTSDTFTIVTGAAGATTLTTTDAAAAAGHFEVAADGNITLDAALDIALEAGGNDITLDSDTLTITSATTQKPRVDFIDTANDADGSRFRLIKNRGAAGQDGDLISAIQFGGYNDAGTPELIAFSSILGSITDATDGQETGKMDLYVAAHGGGQELGLSLKGGSQDDEVDVDIALGTASVTTVAGDLTISGDTLSFASSIGRRATFELAGYAVADGTNYMMADIMSGNKAPFLHDETSIGANGTTADNPAAFLRAAGTVMPYNGALKIWKGWGASNGTPTVDIAIFKYTPTADDATSDSLVLVKNTQITGAGNDNLKAFSEASFSVTVAAGDILITAIKGGTNNKTAYFTSTVEIEWTA